MGTQIIGKFLSLAADFGSFADLQLFGASHRKQPLDRLSTWFGLQDPNAVVHSSGWEDRGWKSPLPALRRELSDEIGLSFLADEMRYLKRAPFPAAGHVVDAGGFISASTTIRRHPRRLRKRSIQPHRARDDAPGAACDPFSESHRYASHRFPDLIPFGRNSHYDGER